MDNQLKLFILACTITGSLSILCEYCGSNMFDEIPNLPNCSAPGLLNCSSLDNQNCNPFSPDYANCTRDTVLGCYKTSFVYTDDNGTQQTGHFRHCAFPSIANVSVCNQETCSVAQANAAQNNDSLISCAAECCFNDSCNHGASPSLAIASSTGRPSTIISTTVGAGQTSVATTVDVTTEPSTTMTGHCAPSPVVHVSCPYFVGLLWLGVVSLL